jgi:heme exporter protein A
LNRKTVSNSAGIAPTSAHSGGLIVDRLAVGRGGRTILSDLTFTVSPGQCLLLTGPNGAGKTTLLKTLAGLLAPLSGTITLTGGEKDAPIAEQAHYVGHANSVRSSLTVQENASFWSRFLGGQPEGIARALDRFGLGGLATVPAAYLSAGQKRRLGLTRLLLAHRPLWLLDEPTASLDANSADVVASVVSQQIASGGMAVIATHLPLGIANVRELKLGPNASQGAAESSQGAAES